MIGDGYFQLRAQIGTSLYSLTSLARELTAPGAALDSLQTLQTRLREPFLFVAIGERGAGKSSLLNALFGRDFASDPLFAGRTVTYRYGTEPREGVLGDGTIDIQRPSIFLRDFTLVEIPDFGAAETLQRLLPTADLALIVLPVKGDPAAAWNVLATTEPEALRRCVFVVQQSDTVSAFELPAHVKRLRHLMLTQFGQACPMFPVSAHTRYGLDNLERYIDREIVLSAARCQSLREICDSGRAILADIGAHSQAVAQAAETRRRRVEEERVALGARRDLSLRDAGGALWALTRLFDSTQSRVAKMLQRKMTLTRIWTDQADWWREFHAELETRLRESITRNLAAAFEKFEADLESAWKQHRDVLRKLHLEPCPPFSHDAAALFARLTADLAACDQNGTATRSVQRVFARVRSRLRLPVGVAVAAVAILGGAIFWSQYLVAAAALVALAGAGVLIAFRIAQGQVLDTLRRLMASRRERVLSYFEEEVRGEIDRFYGTLAVSLHGDEESAATQNAAPSPTIERLRQLDEFFERCSADMAARTPAVPAAGEVAEA